MIERLTVRNYRGVDVPAVLGLVIGGFGAATVTSITAFDSAGVPVQGWVASGAALLVLGAGLVDDLTTPGPRGLRAHLRSLAGGHVTSGTLKLFVIAAASVVAVAAVPGGSGASRGAGALVVAACANLWNGLDVRPGRAIKFFLLVALAGALWFPWRNAPFVPGVGLAALLVLPWDAGERAMLGDAGSNVLGFVVGLGLYHRLSGGWVVIAAALVVSLNLLADTVSLSRAIDAVPPLRWFDRIGRAVDG